MGTHLMHKRPLEGVKKRRGFDGHHRLSINFQENVKHIKENTVLQGATKTLKDFCAHTTIHGIKFIVENATNEKVGSLKTRQKKRFYNRLSKCIWITVCLIGFSFAFVLIQLVWDRYQTTPTLTTIDSSNYPIWNIPFPAVTICNINKVHAPNTKKIAEKLQARGIENSTIYSFFGNLATLTNPEYIDSLFLTTYKILEDLGYTTETLMFELAQPCDNLLLNCSWMGQIVPCDTIFRRTKGSEGFCCSFNYKALKLSLELNTTDSVAEQLYDPLYRVSGSGESAGLSLLLDVQKDDYVAYSKSFYGAEILIHDPQDFPQTSVMSAVAQPGTDLLLSIIPTVTMSEEDVKSLSLRQRSCLFDDEKKLRTTNTYSFQSCMTECIVDAVLNRCDCIPFYYPELNLKTYAGKVRQCTLNDVKCLKDNKAAFNSLRPPSEIEGLNKTTGMFCDCLPCCTEIKYESKATYATRNTDDNLASPLYQVRSNVQNFTTLKVFFKDLTCTKYKRSIFKTWDDTFAAFGGIFSLCLGGSLISIGEFLYFFTFKLYNQLDINKSYAQERENKLKQKDEVFITSNAKLFSKTNMANKINAIEMNEYSRPFLP